MSKIIYLPTGKYLSFYSKFTETKVTEEIERSKLYFTYQCESPERFLVYLCSFSMSKEFCLNNGILNQDVFHKDLLELVLD